MMQQQEEAAQKAPARAAEKSTGKVSDPLWGICLTVLICFGGVSMWAVSYFGLKAPSKAATLPPDVFSWRTEPHLGLMDIDMPEVLIGFKSGDRVFLDASSFCDQPGFRSRAEMDRPVEPQPENMGKLLVETPDISLPKKLDYAIFSIVSTDMAPEVRIFDSPFQWLGNTYGPEQGACLLMGSKTSGGAPQRLDVLDAEPVLALTNTDTLADLRLDMHTEAIRIKRDRRAIHISKHPWLLRWLREFSSNASKRCGSDEFRPLTVLMPMQVRLFPASEQNTHWLAASSCGEQSDWSMVITNEDETVSFVQLGRLRSPDDYKPVEVWTADTDGDGTPEFLVRAQYAGGWRYVLLRLNTEGKAGYELTEIARTAYQGF